MAMYKKPNVSRLSNASRAAAVSNRRGPSTLRGAPAWAAGARGVRVAGLGDYLDDIAAQAYRETEGVTPTPGYGQGTPTSSYSYSGPTGEGVTYGGIQSSSGGGNIASGIMSAFSSLFSSKSSTPTVGIMPTTSNTSTYLLVGGLVLGGILLVTLLK